MLSIFFSFRRIIFFVVFFILIQNIEAQDIKKITIKGNVTDSDNGEELIGATILVKQKETGVVTNVYGFYSITLPKGKYTLVFSYIGYLSQEIEVSLEENKTLNVQLKEDKNELEEIVVLGEEVNQNVISLEMGVSKLEVGTIKKVPALLGEVDVIRTIQLTPGVSTVGEGASGFNVRGGNIDQNLILLDEALLFNSSHLFGLFSVFNSDAIKDVKLVKGGIPAQYGGRLSSLLDVRMKEGNSKRFGMAGGIGTVSSRLTLEAPIIKDKASFIISARRSYADAFLKLSGDQILSRNTAYFYDLSTKLNYKINDRNRIFVSGYFGRDIFNFQDLFNSDWGNAIASIRWNHLFSDKLFANFTGIYSNYNYGIGSPSGGNAFEWKSMIQNYSFKGDFAYYISPKNTLSFGGIATYYDITPGRIAPKSDNSIFNTLSLDHQKAWEYGVYIDNEQKIGNRLSVQYGLRFSAFTLLGKGTYYDYIGEEGIRKEPVNPVEYDNGENIVTYTNFEPRLSLNYQLNESSAIKASYNRTAQYLHLISNTTAAAPTDVWSPSTRNIKPQLADQVALGYFRNFKDNMFESSLEGYYKTMDNQIDYVNGADLLLNEYLEGELVFGKARSYGLELYVKKNTGKLTGWISYTLSKTEQQINGINNNAWYNAKYDRTHNLSLVAIYDLNKKWSFSGTFSYATGISTTFPDARYEYQGLTIPHNSNNSRNDVRVPAYHRLDISATFTPNRKPNRRWKGSWVFSIYNAYARKNPFSIYFRQNENNAQQTEAIRLAILGTILPSVTYNFEF